MGVGGGGRYGYRANATNPFMFIHQQFKKGDNLNFAYRLLANKHLHTYIQTNALFVQSGFHPGPLWSDKNNLKGTLA